MALPIFGEIERFITEHGSAAVLKEHVAFLRDKLDMLKKRIESLEEKNAHLVELTAELEKYKARQEASAQFVEARGALFKRLPSGEYAKTPYCPLCHSAMHSPDIFYTFQCGNQSCKQIAAFEGRHLNEVLHELPL